MIELGWAIEAELYQGPTIDEWPVW